MRRAAPQDDEHARATTIVVTGAASRGRTVADSPVPIDVIGGDQLRELGSDRDQQGPQPAGPVVQLPAAVADRRHRFAAPRDAARPGARPDAGPDQRQAPPPGGAAQPQRFGRPRLDRGRSERDPADRDRPDRGAARRRLVAIWFGCDRRRHQHPAVEARGRQRVGHLRPVPHDDGRRERGDWASPTTGGVPTVLTPGANAQADVLQLNYGGERKRHDGDTLTLADAPRPADRRRRLSSPSRRSSATAIRPTARAPTRAANISRSAIRAN